MDKETLLAYDLRAAAFAQEWSDQPPPLDLQEILLSYFTPGPTADIGCGSGRETAWLNSQGFPTLGYDPSAGLLEEARLLYPGLHFDLAALPELEGIPRGIFDNVVCETVIMHLPVAVIGSSVASLVSLLRPGGVLYLSWRVTEGAGKRDEHGRLYSAFDPALIMRQLDGLEVLLDEKVVSESSGKVVRRVVVRMPG